MKPSLPLLALALLVLAALVTVLAILPGERRGGASPQAVVAAEREQTPEDPLEEVAHPAVDGPPSGGAREGVELPRAAAAEAPAGATLRVFLTDERGAPFPDVRLRLAEIGSRQASRDGEAVTTDRAGKAELHAPRGRELELRARWGARGRWEAAIAPLADGEVREARFELPRGTRLRGLLVDQDGLAVPWQEVWLLPATEDEAAHSFRHYDENGLFARSETDGMGLFEMTDVPPGAWWLGPAAEKQPSVGSVAPVGQRIEIPPDCEVWDVVVTTARGLYIGGRVVRDDPEETPVRAHVLGSSGAAFFNTGSGTDGRFRLGPLTEGAWLLRATTVKDTYSDPIEAQAGDDGIVLRIVAGGRLRAEAIDPRTGQPVPAEFELAPADGRVRSSGGLSPDGRFDTDGLRPGFCDLVARTQDGRVGVAAGVRIVAGETVSVELPLAPGARLDLRVSPERPASEGGLHVAVLQRGAQVAFLSPGMLPGSALVPSGELAVELRSWNPEDPAVPRVLEVRRVQVAPGEEREVELGGG